MISNNQIILSRTILSSINSFKKDLTFFLFYFKKNFKRLIGTEKLFTVLVFPIFLAACINITAGNKPNIAALENKLKIGKSTQQEILRALGEPYGKGAEMLPFRDKPRMMYTYYYEEGSMKDDRRVFLFVFLADDLYDGYMWFSSLPEFKP